jgi:hypothetical protein
MKEIPVTFQRGLLSIEKEVKSKICEVGIQTAEDGRIWICVDGEAFIRFKPLKMKGDKNELETGAESHALSPDAKTPSSGRKSVE